MKDLSAFKIMVVEDDVTYNEALCEMFRLENAEVFSALNGKEALAILSLTSVDFVVSDVQMPVMDGPALLKDLRAKHPDIPIVLLATGHAQLTEKDALSMGANGLIHKPFSFDLLVSTVKDLLLKQVARRAVS